jgi:hypothetical protein
MLRKLNAKFPFKTKLLRPHHYIADIIDPYNTDGITVMSLSDSLQNKPNATTDCLNQKLLHIVYAKLQ